MMRFAKWIFASFAVIAILGIPVGYEMGSGALRPARRELTPALASEAKSAFARANVTAEDISIVSTDGTRLRGWLVVPHDDASIKESTRNWVLLFHGQGDNRIGMIGFAEFLLRAGYAVLMMDSRAQGESGGALATYGAKESEDVAVTVSELERRFTIGHLFAIGVSMGGAIALDATAADPRIEAVVAECPFASLQEASYDYVSGHRGPWLGRTILWPATIAGIYAMEREGHFDAAESAPERAVSRRPFPMLLIADGNDSVLPLRHSERIHAHAIGPKQLWVIPNASHASGLGAAPEEYRSRVLAFFGEITEGAPRK